MDVSYDIVHEATEKVVDVNLAYSGEVANKDDMTTAGWTVASNGNAKVSPTGGTKDATDAVTCYKIAAKDTEYVKSPKLAHDTKEVTVKIFGSSTATGTASAVSVVALDAEGNTLKTGTLYFPASKAGGYFTTAAGSGDTEIKITADANIAYVLVTMVEKNFNVYTMDVSYSYKETIDTKLIKRATDIAYTDFSELPASAEVQTVAEVFDFVMPNGTGLSGDSTAAQFSTGSITFKVAAGATVTVQGYNNYSNYKVNGTEYTNTNSIYFAEDTTVVLEANGLCCLYGIKVEFKGAPEVDPKISTNTTITFGNTSNAATIPSYNSTANCNNYDGYGQPYGGVISFKVAAGATVTINTNYSADYSINDASNTSVKGLVGSEAVPTNKKSFTFAEETVVEITCDSDSNGDNYFYDIEVKFE